MTSISEILSTHRAIYDSFDQNIDSWYCDCNGIRKYRSQDEVELKHITPLLEAHMKKINSGEGASDFGASQGLPSRTAEPGELSNVVPLNPEIQALLQPPVTRPVSWSCPGGFPPPQPELDHSFLSISNPLKKEWIVDIIYAHWAASGGPTTTSAFPRWIEKAAEQIIAGQK